MIEANEGLDARGRAQGAAQGEAVRRGSDRRREAVAQAALALFRARGFDATTVDEIAAAAGVSRRTFFRYFPSKDAAVFPRAEERLRAFEALLAPAPGEAAWATVSRACLEVAAAFALVRAELVLQQGLIAASPVLLARERDLDQRWEDALARALARGYPPRRAAALAGGLLGALRALLRGWYAEDGRPDLVALVREVLDLFEGALGADARPGPQDAAPEPPRAGHRPTGAPSRRSSPGRAPLRAGAPAASPPRRGARPPREVRP